MFTTAFLDFSADWIWLIIFIVAFLLEVNTVGLVSIWFAAGALVALVFAAFDLPPWSQITAFFVVSIICLLTIGKWAKKRFANQNTNVDSLEGKDIVVLKGADYLNLGEGKINGVIWSITCEEGVFVENGDIAVIKGIDGNRLIVKPKKEKNKEEKANV